MKHKPSVSSKTANSAGITLIALVVTIVVLLILAGITIQVVLQGGIIGQANKSKIMTELSVIEEKANLIYADKLMQKINSNLTDKPTMQEVVESLEKEKDCNIEKVAVSESDITGISLDKESMKLDFGASKEIKVSILTSSGEPYTYYAVVECNSNE